MPDEETILKKRLEELERKYRESLFSETEKPKLAEREIDSSEEVKPEETADRIEKTEKEKIPTKKIKPNKPKKIIKIPASKVHIKKIINKKPDNSKHISEDNSNLLDIEITKIENPEHHKRILLPEIKENKPHKKDIKIFSEKIKELKQEIRKIIIGQDNVIEGLIRALICNGHVILEGVPGTAKTLLIKALGKISDCEVKRIQFTVDLLPTDIIGVTTYKEKKGFKVIKGPIFGNFIIADEINRAPPKTQSALLEAMQERQVTIGRETFPLPKPFFVMATKNPIESAGVYSLPEAQLDRFLFRLLINYPKNEEEKLIMKQNADLKDFEDFDLKQVISKKEIIEMQKIVKKVYLNKKIEDYIIKIVDSTRNKKNRHSKFIEWGASPRASIALFIASKAEALMSGRSFVVPEDVKKVTLDVLGHRIILSYEAEANEISPEKLLEGILKDIK